MAVEFTVVAIWNLSKLADASVDWLVVDEDGSDVGGEVGCHGDVSSDADGVVSPGPGGGGGPHL